MQSTKLSDERIAVDIDFKDDIAISAKDDQFELTYRCLLPSANVNSSTIQKVLRKALFEHFASEASASSSSDAIASPRQHDQKPRTKKGVELPLEIDTKILGFLKSDHQVHSLTSFQQCSKYTYEITRPIIYTDMVVSLLGLAKIRTTMHLPTAKLYLRNEIEGARLEDMEVAANKIMSDDEKEGTRALNGLDDGESGMWYGLEGSKRLRYNLRAVHRMTVVEAGPSVRKRFLELWSDGNSRSSQRWYKSIKLAIEHDWFPGDTREIRHKYQCPFSELRDIKIEKEFIHQIITSLPSKSATCFYPDLSFEIILSPLSALMNETLRSAIAIDLASLPECSTIDRITEAIDMPHLRDVLPHGCSQVELRGITEPDEYFFLAQSFTSNFGRVILDWKFLEHMTWKDTLNRHVDAFRYLIEDIDFSLYGFPMEVKWVVRGPWESCHASLTTLHSQTDAASSMGTEELRSIAKEMEAAIRQKSWRYGYSDDELNRNAEDIRSRITIHFLGPNDPFVTDIYDASSMGKEDVDIDSDLRLGQ